MMLARHSKPMEISSPELVFNPLWQATQRSDVRNSASTAFETCLMSDFGLSDFGLFGLGDDWPATTSGTVSTVARRRASRSESFISSLPTIYRPPSPRERTSPLGGYVP